MGQSPLELKPIILALPFRPLSAKPASAPAQPACDPAANANVLVALGSSGAVARWFTCSGTVAARIPIPNAIPFQVEITPDAKQALVTTLSNFVAVIDTASNTVSASIPIDPAGQTCGIAITPDGTRAYVTSCSTTNPELLAIDIASRSVVATLPVTTYPLAVSITPDGSLAYVSFPLQDTIYVVDTLTNSISTTIGGISRPYGIDFNPTGTMAYVASGATPGAVKVLNTTTYEIVKSYSVGDRPVDVRVDPEGRWVIVTNYASGSVSEIDTLTGTVRSNNTGSNPMGFAFVR